MEFIPPLSFTMLIRIDYGGQLRRQNINANKTYYRKLNTQWRFF